jgi:hypothetical protein
MYTSFYDWSYSTVFQKVLIHCRVTFSLLHQTITLTSLHSCHAILVLIYFSPIWESLITYLFSYSIGVDFLHFHSTSCAIKFSTFTTFQINIKTSLFSCNLPNLLFKSHWQLCELTFLVISSAVNLDTLLFKWITYCVREIVMSGSNKP